MKYLIGCFYFLIFSAQAQNTLADGDKSYALGNFSKAITIYESLPVTKEQQLKLAKSYEQIGNLKKALTHYENLFTVYPEDIFVAYEYSKLLRKTANNTKAEEIIKSLIVLDSLNPNFPYLLGLIQEQKDDTLSKHYFKKAYDLDANHIPALGKVATFYIKERHFSEADSLLTKGLKIDDSNFQLWNLKALNHFYQKDFHKSVESYKKLLELHRPSENVHQKLGYAYIQTNRYEEAIEHYRIAINEYEDQNPLTHYEIAQAYIALHYLDKAKRHIEIAMLLKEPQLDNEYLALMEIYLRQKDFKKNFETTRMALSHNPENEMFLYRQAVAADNYLKDKSTVITYYENYMAKFGETGRFRILTAQRISDLKKEIHMAKD